MEKIKLTTSGVPLTQRRAQEPNIDHAVEILNYTDRGYVVTAKAPETIWSVSFYMAKGSPEQPAFVNLPEGKYHSVQVRPYKGSEDARVLDEPYPEWITTLINLVDRAAPDHINVKHKEPSNG